MTVKVTATEIAIILRIVIGSYPFDADEKTIQFPGRHRNRHLTMTSPLLIRPRSSVSSKRGCVNPVVIAIDETARQKLVH